MRSRHLTEPNESSERAETVQPPSNRQLPDSDTTTEGSAATVANRADTAGNPLDATYQDDEASSKAG